MLGNFQMGFCLHQIASQAFLSAEAPREKIRLQILINSIQPHVEAS